MVLIIVVEAVPAASKAPGTVRVRISAGERHDSGTTPLSTRASSLEQGRAGGPVEPSPKLARRIGSVSCAEELSPLITPSAAAVPSVCLQTLVYFVTSTSMARRDCRVSCSRLT